jgi:hypothetical protein
MVTYIVSQAGNKRDGSSMLILTAILLEYGAFTFNFLKNKVFSSAKAIPHLTLMRIASESDLYTPRQMSNSITPLL